LRTNGATPQRKEAANRRATEAQVLEDAERLIAAWNGRQARRMPMFVLADNRGSLWEETMDWFRRTASIAGIQVPNYWMLVLVAVVVIWIIYSLAAH
jgi:hypothetical protein